MSNLERRRELRAKRTVESNHAKFISQYMKSKHPDIYAEAEQVYQSMKERNPGRKDITKTIDFLKFTTPYTTYPVYYYQRRKTTQKNKGDTAQTTKNIRHTMHDMVLNIPLISSQEMAARSDISHPPDITEQPPAIHEQPPTIPEQPPAIHEHPPAVHEQPPPIHEQPQAIPEQQLVIPDQLYEDLLQELRQDPDLYRIFNNMDSPGNDMDIPDSDMWDVFNMCEPTPLEAELARQGF